MAAAALTLAMAGGASAEQGERDREGDRSGVVGYGLAGGESLVKFDVSRPAGTRFVGRVRGLGARERLVGIDFRLRTGELVGLGSGANVYAIDPVSARATKKSSLTVGAAPVALDGTSFGIDFNPTVDRLRVVSDREQNLRINVDTGATTVDKPLNYVAPDLGAGRDPSVVGAAYTNNDNDEIVVPPATPTPGKTGTQLFDLDSGLDTLALQAPPNDGVLKTVGPLGVAGSSVVGFDVFSAVVGGQAVRNAAYASLRTGILSTRLYTVDLATGKATRVGGFGPFGLIGVSDVAIRPQG